jgi:hypothetical protein
LQIFNIDGTIYKGRIAYVSKSSFGEEFLVLKLIQKQLNGFSIGEEFDLLRKDLPVLICRVIYEV